MNLVIDIGNTRTKIAIFESGEIIFNSIIDEFSMNEIEAIFQRYPNLKNGIISSVKDYPGEIKKFIQNSINNFIELDHTTNIPLVNKYKTPETLGKDRLAATVGANQLFPNQNLLVIDAGTAITFDFVSERNEYLGGNISPGIEIRFKALHQFTGKLPLINQKEEFEEIGTNTESAIRAGIQLGVLFEIEQYIDHFNKLYQNLQIIITGGDSYFFDKKLKKTIFVDFNLNLLGLNRILEYNVEET